LAAAYRLCQQAATLSAQRQFANADAAVRKALDIAREVLGEGHPFAATCYDGLAHNLGTQARYAEAEVIYQKALDIRRAALGEKHPDTARSYASLAANVHHMGK